MKAIEGASITSAQGYHATGLHAGIKKKAGALDLALLVSEADCAAAAVFTTNKVKAAPVLYDQEVLSRTGPAGPAAARIRALVVNSGNANACTGQQGLENTRNTAKRTAQLLSQRPGAVGAVEPEQVLVMSTGVIGMQLNMPALLGGLEQAVSKLQSEVEGGALAAQAIMTTDTRPKRYGMELELSGKRVVVAGMSKGAGMIHPNMATLLATIVTDAAVSPPVLQAIIHHAVDRSFNMISVDNDTSTNDTLLLLANGVAGNVEINQADGADFRTLQEAVTQVAIALAQMIVRDGEGATKFITVHVKGAPRVEDARRVVDAISCSALVKTAIYGKDANWGRIVCAAGYSGAPIEIERVNLWFSNPDSAEPMLLLEKGTPIPMDEVRARAILEETDVNITLDLGLGSAEAIGWTSDLSHEYVSINADYRT